MRLSLMKIIKLSTGNTAKAGRDGLKLLWNMDRLTQLINHFFCSVIYVMF
jgi:hypothetical protein